MSQSRTGETKKDSSLSIPNILADFFLKKIDMASHSDDSDLKRKSKKKKSKHKRSKHKKSKHHHQSGSFSSSSESSGVVAKGFIDAMSSSEEMDIKRLKKIKKMKLQSVSDTVLKSSEIKADVQTSSMSKKTPMFYGPSLELLLSGVESNTFDSKSVQNSSSVCDVKLSKNTLNTVKISLKNELSENTASKNSDVALPSSSMASDPVTDNNTNNDVNISASCTDKNDRVANSKCENGAKNGEKENSCKSDRKTSSKCASEEFISKINNKGPDFKNKPIENPCENASSKINNKGPDSKNKPIEIPCKNASSKINNKGPDSKNKPIENPCEKASSKINNKGPDSKNKPIENPCENASSNEKNSINSGLANNEASVKDANHKKKNQDNSADAKSKTSKKKHSRSRSRSKSRNRHASPKAKHTRRRSKSSSRDSRTARKKRRHSRSRSRSRDRLRSRDRKRRSHSKSRSRSRSRHGYRRHRRNSRSNSPHRRHGRRKTRSRSRSHSRFRRHSKSRTRRSRSRERRRSTSKSKHSKSRKSRSRSRSKRSKSRSKRSKTRSRSRHRSPLKRKSRSNSTEKKSTSYKSGKIDQAKILETARKNVLKMMKSGTLPEGLPVENIKKEQIISIQSGGKSVQELTDFCQRLSQKENEPDASDNDDNGDKTEDESGFIHHPFKLKEPGMIKLNIKNAVQLPIKTHAQKVAELSSQFPVSSGNQHKKKELEWIPVVPKSTKTETKPETTVSTVTSTKNAVVAKPEVTVAPILPPPPPPPIAISYPCPPPPEVPKVEEMPVISVAAPPIVPVVSVVSQMQTAVPCPTIYQMSGEHVMQTYVSSEQQMQYSAISVPLTTFSVPSFPTYSTPPTASVFPPKPPKKLDISSIVTKRFQAITKLQGNPNDPESLKTLQDVQESIEEWVQSQQVPGLFTGSTDAKVLSAAELCGPYSKYHKSRKDFLSQAPPVTSGKGMSLLKKMGWNPGEGLGKNKEGSLEPLVLDIKMDKKGLVSEGENSKKGVSSFIQELQGKHPVSALMELCSKRRWKPPLYTCVVDTGPPHKKLFCFKVEVNGVEYQPVNPSSNKKIAKADSAVLCLQALNVLPKSA